MGLKQEIEAYRALEQRFRKVASEYPPVFRVLGNIFPLNSFLALSLYIRYRLVEKQPPEQIVREQGEGGKVY